MVQTHWSFETFLQTLVDMLSFECYDVKSATRCHSTSVPL